MTVFSERLKWLRNKKGLTQNQVGEQVGMSGKAYSKYEYGLREPNLETLAKLPAILGESTDFLLGITNMDESTNNMRLGMLEAKAQLNRYKLEIALTATQEGDEEYIKLKIRHLSDLIEKTERQVNVYEHELESALAEIPGVTKDE